MARAEEGSSAASGHDDAVSEDHAPDRFPNVADVYRMVGLEAPTLRRADVAERTGIEPERSIRWWRAMGFPEVSDDLLAFGEQDVAMVTRLDRLIGGGALSDDDALRLARLMGASFSRLVDAQLALIEDVLLAGPAGTPKSSAVQLISRLGEEGEVDILEAIEDAMSYVWRRHLMAALAQRLTTGDKDEQAIGFADLSGFSRVSKRAEPVEIARIVDTFEAAAFDVVSGHSGRVVKLIGDEVMFVTADLDESIDIAVELIDRLAKVDGMPPVHCGLAQGSVVSVGGDIFGPTVNLASRLTQLARPGTVVVPREENRHLLDREDLDVRKVRRLYDLKGIGRTSVLVIRPLSVDAGS